MINMKKCNTTDFVSPPKSNLKGSNVPGIMRGSGQVLEIEDTETKKKAVIIEEVDIIPDPLYQN